MEPAQVAVHFLIMAGGVWRLSRMLADPTESGPYDVLIRLRSWLGWRWDEFSNLEFSSTGIVRQLAMAVACMKCSSVWFGLLATVAYLINPNVATFLALPLAISAVAVITEEALNG